MTSNGRVLVLADDLTGALEAGAKFARQEIATLVRVDPVLNLTQDKDAASALVIDTETRHASPLEAKQRIFELARNAKLLGFKYFYKKTDSTLRGNIASELAGLLAAFSRESLLYVPAYPRMGRTVKNGFLHVQDIAVSRTSFADDALNPVIGSHIPSLLAAHGSLPVISVKLDASWKQEAPAIYVCDGESDEEVRKAARIYADSKTLTLAAGPAAFLHHFARFLDDPRSQAPALPRVRSALVVNGSRHNVSLEQLKYGEENGIGGFDPATAPEGFTGSGWFILKWGGEAMGESPLDLAQRQARRVRSILSQFSLDALIIFGGDTAYATLQELGKPAIHPMGEAMEGIPVARLAAKDLDASVGARIKDLTLVTKAGGFGPVDVLPQLRDVLR